MTFNKLFFFFFQSGLYLGFQPCVRCDVISFVYVRKQTSVRVLPTSLRQVVDVRDQIMIL